MESGKSEWKECLGGLIEWETTDSDTKKFLIKLAVCFSVGLLILVATYPEKVSDVLEMGNNSEKTKNDFSNSKKKNPTENFPVATIDSVKNSE